MSRNTGGDPLGRTPPDYHRHRILDQNRHDPWYPNDDYYHRPPGGGGGHRYYKLLEDAVALDVLASPCDRTGAAVAGDPGYVGNWLDIITGAPAGYVAQYCLISGNWDFQQGPCFTACTSSGSIGIAGMPGGTVGVAYPGYTITETGLDGGSLSVSGLPPGLSEAGGVISGTPTTAGTYAVVASGTSPGTGDSAGTTCTVTRAALVTIAE